MSDFLPWTEDDAARRIRIPEPDDDKYTRGVLGIITGSEQYPGAAVLGVEAALRTGVGMVRYLGGERAGDLVLQRRPEAVLGNGRVQAWLIGSGTDAAHPEPRSAGWVDAALAQNLPTVLDGGAIERVRDTGGPTVITPHYRELGRVLGVDPAEIASDAGGWARRASDALGVTVLLKGSRTYVCGGGIELSVTGAPAWTATAGAGDALGGILGALVATHADSDAAELARLAATAALIHGLAAERASGGGPFTILDLAAAVPATIAQLLR
ncbi:NAD(P)H-hydrate dehydratase [Glaciihabitans arcticus]|uniref:ADP-dependent (S)-NAD(P)H-hydrate dehydratase n=1 Tax=Glaciihabitans arcticus TaxID=2668039 RepID=A0A4Q9GUL4_9MICO|nr:ADP/ATP-dependent (S)-NAD(P)H-hydrate dehydratase [Glaciihabitans arcticus]TBN56253.1 NAD(P)H-hydrate dehydratase [Glaciihabitans arcticus]